jgi:hypothetical protein
MTTLYLQVVIEITDVLDLETLAKKWEGYGVQPVATLAWGVNGFPIIIKVEMKMRTMGMAKIMEQHPCVQNVGMTGLRTK